MNSRDMTHGNGVAVALAYDLDGRLSAMDAFDGATPVLDLDYTFDLASYITDIDDNGGGIRGRNYTYDSLHRLTQAQELAAGGAPVTLQTDYTYDAVGNRLTRNAGGAMATYGYATLSNHLDTVMAGATVRSIAYSPTGNTATDNDGLGTVLTHIQDSTDRLVEVRNGAATVAAYLHNALGQRVEKTIGSTVTHYVYDLGGRLVAEVDGVTGTTITEFIWLAGAPVAYYVGTSVFYVHTDHIGAPQVITDATAAVVWDADYHAFGKVSVTGALTFNLRFAGQYFDDETGLHYNYFRDYDPTTGRYIQSDPIGLSGGWNIYAYVGGNPVMLVDMFGLEYPDVSVSCDTSGPITLSVALCHYFHGDGSDLTMNFSDVDTGYMPSDFPKFKTLLKNSYKKYVNLTIPDNSYRRSADVGGAPGNMTFVLKGDFSSNPCCWEFDGYVGALNDPFDFDSKPWGVRDWWKEVGTRIYGMGDGTKFDIVFQGVRPVYQKVQW